VLLCAALLPFNGHICRASVLQDQARGSEDYNLSYRDQAVAFKPCSVSWQATSLTGLGTLHVGLPVTILVCSRYIGTVLGRHRFK
jgi:hypothetical protein